MNAQATHQVCQPHHVRLIPLDGYSVSRPALSPALIALLTWDVKPALTSPLTALRFTWNSALAGRPVNAQATHQAHQLRLSLLIRLDGHSTPWTVASSAPVACFTGIATLGGRSMGVQATHRVHYWCHFLLVHVDDHRVFCTALLLTHNMTAASWKSWRRLHCFRRMSHRSFTSRWSLLHLS